MKQKDIATIIGQQGQEYQYEAAFIIGQRYETMHAKMLANDEEEVHRTLQARGYLILSPQEFHQLLSTLTYDPAQVGADRVENKRIDRVFSIMIEEEPILEEVRKKYPPEKMEEELKHNPRPTMVQALERGLAWSPTIPGEETHQLFRREEDNNISSTLLGALYIGCFGLDAVEEVICATPTYSSRHPENQAFHLVIDRIEDTIKWWKRRNGTHRDLNRHYDIYVSGAVRGGRYKQKSEVWYKDLEKDVCEPRTKFLRWAQECDERLEESLKRETERWQKAQDEK